MDKPLSPTPAEGARETPESEVLAGLEYIANSPVPKYGGFHPNVVKTAQDALVLIALRERERNEARRERNIFKESHEKRIEELNALATQLAPLRAAMQERKNQ